MRITVDLGEAYRVNLGIALRGGVSLMNQSPNLQMMRIPRRQQTPFGQHCGAVLFKCFSAG
jgi:hypothetical protein